MKKFFKDLFCGPSNEHYELARVCLALTTLGLLIFQGYAIFKGQPFSPETFGIGAATILGGGGLGVALKDRARGAVCPEATTPTESIASV